MLKCWGLIPARGGSKGVPRKNVREVNGLPLIAYSIRAALASQTLTGVVVSTDDEQIAEIARRYGAQVPFLRPSHLATDTASDFQVLSHFADWLQGQGTGADAIAYLRPTTPFKTAQLIDRGVKQLNDNPELSGVRSVTRVDGVFHPYWMFATDQRGALHAFIDGISVEQYYQRQLLPSCYRLNGVCDLLRLANLKAGNLYGDRVGALTIPESQALDIDTEQDLKWFEFLLQQQV